MRLRAAELRSAIDSITLQITENGPTEDSLEDAISEHALSHIRRMMEDGTLTDPNDVERVGEAIVKGVLKRLIQIAESGGQMGSA